MTLGEGPSGATSLDGLRAWTAREPERIAVLDEREAVTFAELLRRVEATSVVARAALAEAPPGAYLPVLVDRSAASVVATLACLIGRVRYVPVDAKAPPALLARLRSRVGDPGCYLVGAQTADGIPGATAIEVTGETGGIEAPAASADTDEPAVVIFSSGSTGDPKGIVLSRATLERRWRSRDLVSIPLGDDRREPLLTPLDSAWGLNLVLDIASGFTEYVVDVGEIGLPRFLAAMAQFRPTAMAIPSQLGRLIGQLPERSVVRLPSLRRVNIGSEGFRYEYVRALASVLEPDTSIVHSLASSEGGREFANAFPLADAPPEGVVHVGRMVFPDQTRLVPVEGQPDDVTEVHVSGAIASEYFGDPELTAARFYADPDGRRWWRSGDLVRVDADGRFRHVSRMDDVVKVGGKLASPADVTAVLLSVDGIRAAITVPVVTDGNTRLVAHVELEAGRELTLPAVREVLAARLQRHAVPAAVMRHARLPINVRGKVDRQALADGPFEPW